MKARCCLAAILVAVCAHVACAADTRYDRGVHMLTDKNWDSWRKKNPKVSGAPRAAAAPVHPAAANAAHAVATAVSAQYC